MIKFLRCGEILQSLNTIQSEVSVHTETDFIKPGTVTKEVDESDSGDSLFSY